MSVDGKPHGPSSPCPARRKPTSAPARQKKKLVECAFIFSGVRDWHGQDPNQVLTALSPCGPYRWQHSGTPSDYASESSVSWWSLVYNMYIRYNEENISVAVCECDRHIAYVAPDLTPTTLIHWYHKIRTLPQYSCFKHVVSGSMKSGVFTVLIKSIKK